MAQWYSVATPDEQDRLVGAWPDAPIENLEVCEFILDTAREQVIAYAPTEVPPVYEPYTLRLVDIEEGTPVPEATGTITRAGNLVTVTAHYPRPEGTPAAGDADCPAWAMPAPGTTVMVGSQGSEQLVVTELVFLLDTYRFVAIYGRDAYTLTYLGRDAEGDGTPSRYVLAQLQQAVNLWNAGRVTGTGEVGVEQFTFMPRPLDKTIRGIIRPIDGTPDVY